MYSKPKLSPNSKKIAQNQTRDGRYENQWEYLHGDSINKNKNLRRDTLKDEVEFNKEPEAFTFQPNPDKVDPNRRAANPDDLSTFRRASLRTGLNSSPGAAGPEVFQINVNIKGQKKVITANTDSDPAETAQRFINKYGVDQNYHSTLTDLIADQQKQIHAKQSQRK